MAKSYEQMDNSYPRPMQSDHDLPSTLSSRNLSITTVSSVDGKGSQNLRVQPVSFGRQNGVKPWQSVNTRIVQTSSEMDLEQHTPNIDLDLRSRNLAIFALATAWCIGFASLICGAKIYIGPHADVPSWFLKKIVVIGGIEYNFWPFKPPRHTPYITGHVPVRLPIAATYLIPLVLNILLTVVCDSMNSIPATTMRWALQREGRLGYNSNLRLFTSSRHFAPNKWYANVLSCIALVMAYGGISSISFQFQILGAANLKGNVISTEVDGGRWGLDFNAWGFIGLGIGLILQSSMVTWALVASRNQVPTWNSNPLGKAKACLALGDARIGPLARLSSPTTTDDLNLSHPSHKQPNMLKLAPQTRTIARIVWTLFALVSLWPIIIGVLASRTGSMATQLAETAEFLQLHTSLELSDYWTYYGAISFKYADASATSAYYGRRDWLGLTIQCIALSMITLGIHCVEMIAHAARDEAMWRRATTTRGADPNQSVFMAGLSNWPNLVLFAFKSLIHWIFGNAFITDTRVFMNLLPLVALSLSFLALAIFTEVLIRWRPRGPQPAAFGNLEVLVGVIDEWEHPRLCWGDKGEVKDGIRLAGTRGSRLPEVHFDAWYLDMEGPKQRQQSKII